MKQTKRMIALLLALCLMLCACGGKAATPEDALFSDEKMDGVEHDGFRIRADSATEEQVMYAALYQTKEGLSHPAKGYEHLREVTLYYLTSDEDGQWYQPVAAKMPFASTDDMYMDAYNTCGANFGNLRLHLEATTFKLSDEELASMRSTPTWEDMNEKQMHLAVLTDDYVTLLEVDRETELIIQQYNDDFAVAVFSKEVDGATKLGFIQTNLLNQGANGEYTVAATVLIIDHLYELTDEESAACDEIMSYYNLIQWMDLGGEE